MTIPDDADATLRPTGQVAEVTEATGERFASGRPDPADPDADYLLAPPCTCAVSAEVTLPFAG